MQHVPRTKCCSRNRNFSQKRGCHTRKSVAATFPCNISPVCADLQSLLKYVFLFARKPLGRIVNGLYFLPGNSFPTSCKHSFSSVIAMLLIETELQLCVNFLFAFQGEDVSMGIWLSAVGPILDNVSLLSQPILFVI